MARGGQAQFGHLPSDRVSLAPGAVRSCSGIYGLGCLLHEEGIFLRGDGITSHIVSSSESEVDYSSVEEDDEEEDVYIPPILDDDELNNPPDPRLELVDNQFNLRMKELFTQTSNGKLVPITIEATVQQTTDALIQHLTKSHPLTWGSQFKTTPEEDELPLWMSIMKDDIDVLVTQFQQQMYRRLSAVMSEMVKLYHK